MKVTADMLRRAGACSTQLRAFEREWPDGAEVTLENVQRAHYMGLDLTWFAERLFSTEAWRAFLEAKEAAHDAYIEAAQPDWLIYVETENAARRVGNADAACVAWRDYNKATAPAWAAYTKAWVTAFFDAFELKGDQAVCK